MRCDETWDWPALHELASRMTRRILDHQTDAEDAAQEALLRAYRAIERGASPDNVEAWVVTIARREAYRIHERTRPVEPLDDWLLEAATADHSDATLDRIAAQDVLRGVSADTRELLLRRFALDQTSSEIASDTGMPAATVRVRLHRILGQLQRELDPDAGPERRERAAKPALTDARVRAPPAA